MKTYIYIYTPLIPFPPFHYPPWNQHFWTWKWMVGILISFWDVLFSWAFAVSFRECNQHLQPTHRKGAGCLSRRIFVNFSQSVAKLWNKWRTGSRMTKAPKGGMRSITAAQFVWRDNGEYIPLKFKMKGKRIDPCKKTFLENHGHFQVACGLLFLITCFRLHFWFKNGEGILEPFSNDQPKDWESQPWYALLWKFYQKRWRFLADFLGPLTSKRGDLTWGKGEIDWRMGFLHFSFLHWPLCPGRCERGCWDKGWRFLQRVDMVCGSGIAFALRVASVTLAKKSS